MSYIYLNDKKYTTKPVSLVLNTGYLQDQEHIYLAGENLLKDEFFYGDVHFNSVTDSNATLNFKHNEITFGSVPFKAFLETAKNVFFNEAFIYIPEAGHSYTVRFDGLIIREVRE